MAIKLVLAVVALVSAHATIAPQELALMQQELTVAGDVVFGGKHTDQEKSLMGLLSGGKDTPERSQHLRSLAKEILDEDKAKTETVAAKTVAKTADVKPHEPVKKPLLAKKAKGKIHRTVASIGSQLAGFEEVMTSLMLSKSGADATPMAAQVEKIRIVIEDEMLPAIEQAHTDDKDALQAIYDAAVACGTDKDDSVTTSKISETTFTTESPLHKDCRKTEGEDLTAKEACHETEAELLTEKDLLCGEFVTLSGTLSDEAANKDAVSKGVGESDQTYIKKINDAFCNPSDLANWEDKKQKCDDATTDYDTKHAECNNLDDVYATKHTSCNNMQKVMDDAACSHAQQNKAACTEYSTCMANKETEYANLKADVEDKVTDRELEWRGTKRMQCIIIAFQDGKIEDSEITTCKDKTHATDHLEITYHTLPSVVACTVPDMYPASAAYKVAEFNDLPATAPGDMDANVCLNIMTVSTVAGPGNTVDGCSCEEVTLSGAFSPGALVKCTGCNDVYRSQQANSCPEGLKLFAPRSKSDWETFFGSASTNGNPHFIIDVTRPQNSCGGCKDNAMNSGNAQQASWVTQDGAAWWLRDDTYGEPNGDYTENCYLAVGGSASSMTFNDGNCNYHSNNYYCQPSDISLTPNPDATESGCVCENIELTGTYSPGYLLKCTGCRSVSKSSQANSCPVGTKIFSPRSRSDWETFFSSATPLRSPNWIVDVTRDASGTSFTSCKMNSGETCATAWVTADGTPWWFRDSTYSEPNGDYTANCYLDLWAHPTEQDNADNVVWNDGNCGYSSNAYYCQPTR